MKFKYIDFIKTFTINIPAIQRDYVQGANKNAGKRDEFLDAIFNALLNPQQPLKLDFIYGASSKEYFLPIDGQQRLTTLALTGWMLSRRAFPADRLKSTPSLAMVYNVRTASEQFVDALFNKCNLPDGVDWKLEKAGMSSYLTKVPEWFAEQWVHDPTVSAMLEMLDALYLKLQEYSDDDILRMAENLFTNSPIEFESLDMPEYRLTEDLYVKMNARGKHLTRFENWKAEFYGFIQSRYGQGKADLFSENIEHRWCNLFWTYAVADWDESQSDVYPCIDELFMRLFDLITETLYYAQTNVEAKAKELKIDNADLYSHAQHKNELEVYSTGANLDTLFDMLDRLSALEEIHGSVNGWLDKLLTDRFNRQSDRVNIFDSTDLFTRIIFGKDISRPLRLLFYGILLRNIKYPDEAIGATTVFARILWGWLLSRDQRLAQGLDVRHNIRVEDIAQAQKVIDVLNTDADSLATVIATAEPLLKNEREKAQWTASGKYDAIRILGNHPYLRGNFGCIYPALKVMDASALVDRFLSFASLPSDKERVRVLVSYGSKGAHPWNSYDFYGCENHWPYIFTATNKSVVNAVTDYLTDAAKKTYGKDTMEYYLLKYDEFLKASDGNYFYRTDDFTVWALKVNRRRPLNGYNSCPYSFAVVARCPMKAKLNLKEYSWYSDHGSLWSEATGILMECVKSGWKISIYNQELWDDSGLQQVFGSIIDTVLPDYPGKDRIESALEFLSQLGSNY